MTALRTVALTAGVLLLAACGASSGDDPADSTSPPSAEAAGEAQAPADAEPEETPAASPEGPPDLDLSAYADDPCPLVDPALFADYGMTEGRGAEPRLSESVTERMRCAWTSHDSPFVQNIGVQVNTDGGGLDQLIAADGAALGYFEEIEPVAGRPAALGELGAEPRGSCAMYVRLTAEIMLDVSVFITSTSDDPQIAAAYEDPCPTMVEIGTRVVENLPTN